MLVPVLVLLPALVIVPALVLVPGTAYDYELKLECPKAVHVHVHDCS